jgi:hypothetical protein
LLDVADVFKDSMDTVVRDGLDNCTEALLAGLEGGSTEVTQLFTTFAYELDFDALSLPIRLK